MPNGIQNLPKLVQKIPNITYISSQKFAKSLRSFQSGENSPNLVTLNETQTDIPSMSEAHIVWTHPPTHTLLPSELRHKTQHFSKVIYLHLLWWTSLNVSLSLFLYLFPSLFLSFSLSLSLSLSLCPVQSWIEIFCFSTWLWIFLFDVNHSIYLNCPTWRHGQDVTRLAFLFLSQFSQTKLDLICIISTVWPNNGDDCSKWNLNCIINVNIIGRYLIQATT